MSISKKTLDDLGVDRFFARGGCEIVSDNTALTGKDICAIVVLAETTFSVLAATDVAGATSVALPAGTVITSFAGITAVTGDANALYVVYYNEGGS